MNLSPESTRSLGALDQSKRARISLFNEDRSLEQFRIHPAKVILGHFASHGHLKIAYNMQRTKRIQLLLRKMD